MCPLTERGHKVMKSMVKTYGPKKAKQVFYAMINEGKLKNVEGKSKPKSKTSKRPKSNMKGEA